MRARARKTVASIARTTTSWHSSLPGPFSLTWQLCPIEIRVLLSASLLQQARGGRRSGVMPLVVESLTWQHGVFLGASVSSETTAAAAGQVGQLRHDPFAMLPFCGSWPCTDEVVLDTQSKEEAIAQLLVMPFDQVVSLLSSRRRLEENLAERDLALGCLVRFYYFNLPQALSEKGLPVPKQVP